MSDPTATSAPTAKSFPRWVLWAWAVALLAFPVVLWLLPADHFDEGESMCPSVALFDTECPGCGSTRAVQHLHHGELAEALYFHQLSPLIYLFLVGLWGYWLYNTGGRLGWFGRARAERIEERLRAEHQARLDRRHAADS